MSILKYAIFYIFGKTFYFFLKSTRNFYEKTRGCEKIVEIFFHLRYNYIEKTKTAVK